MTNENEEAVSYSAYWRSVEQSAIEIVADVKKGVCTDVYDRIHEECDGSFWVIYTHAAMATLRHSPNDDAIFEDGNGIEGATSMSDVYTRAAFWALQADITEKVTELQAELEEATAEEE
jgi:hypothetical protein